MADAGPSQIQEQVPVVTCEVCYSEVPTADGSPAHGGVIGCSACKKAACSECYSRAFGASEMPLMKCILAGANDRACHADLDPALVEEVLGREVASKVLWNTIRRSVADRDRRINNETVFAAVPMYRRLEDEMTTHAEAYERYRTLDAASKRDPLVVAGLRITMKQSLERVRHLERTLQTDTLQQLRLKLASRPVPRAPPADQGRPPPPAGAAPLPAGAPDGQNRAPPVAVPAPAGADATEGTVRVLPRIFNCPTEGCNGAFEDTPGGGACPVCGIRACLACHESLGGSDAAHACKPENVETVNLIKSGQFQTCPSCRAVVQRRSGCRSMFCTNCSTFFDFATAAFDPGAAHHNPEFLARPPEERAAIIQRHVQEGRMPEPLARHPFAFPWDLLDGVVEGMMQHHDAPEEPPRAAPPPLPLPPRASGVLPDRLPLLVPQPEAAYVPGKRAARDGPDSPGRPLKSRAVGNGVSVASLEFLTELEALGERTEGGVDPSLLEEHRVVVSAVRVVIPNGEADIAKDDDELRHRRRRVEHILGRTIRSLAPAKALGMRAYTLSEGEPISHETRDADIKGWCDERANMIWALVSIKRFVHEAGKVLRRAVARSAASDQAACAEELVKLREAMLGAPQATRKYWKRWLA